MMELLGQLLMVWSLLAVTTAGDAVLRAFNCKVSNEGCESDEECCSQKCLQAHPGTNPRCTRSSLHNSCLYNYQCEDRLICGPANTCCSKYWGTCIRNEDCCHPIFICVEASGFYYKRCLMGSVSRGSQKVKATNMQWSSLILVLLTMASVHCVTAMDYDVL